MTLRKTVLGIRAAHRAPPLRETRAYVEDHWFCHVLGGRERCSPWDAVQLRALWASAVETSRQQWIHFAAEHANPMDVPVERPVRGEMSARWVITHMVEKYARHCGHADLLREAIDGATGD